MILVLLVLLGIVVISARLLLKKVDKLGNGTDDSIRGDFFGFVTFYTLFLIMFFALITRNQDNEQQIKEETTVESVSNYSSD